MSILIWIETVWHLDTVPERFFFFKKLVLKKVSWRQQKHEELPSMQRAKTQSLTLKPKL